MFKFLGIATSVEFVIKRKFGSLSQVCINAGVFAKAT